MDWEIVENKREIKYLETISRQHTILVILRFSNVYLKVTIIQMVLSFLNIGFGSLYISKKCQIRRFHFVHESLTLRLGGKSGEMKDSCIGLEPISPP